MTHESPTKSLDSIRKPVKQECEVLEDYFKSYLRTDVLLSLTGYSNILLMAEENGSGLSSSSWSPHAPPAVLPRMYSNWLSLWSLYTQLHFYMMMWLTSPMFEGATGWRTGYGVLSPAYFQVITYTAVLLT